MRYIFYIFVFLFFSFSVSGQDLNLAKDYLKRGEYEKAESLYKKLFENRKNSFNYLEGLTQAHQEQEKYPAAEKYLKEIQQRSSHSTVIYIKLGNNYELPGDTENAFYFYYKAIA